MHAYRGVPGDRPLTIEEFERLPEDGYRLELVRGRLVREPPPGAEHGDVTGELFFALKGFVRERRLGRVVVEAGFVLAEDPPTVRAPDIAFIAAERVPAGGLPAGYFHGPPDVAVEVVSPSNAASEIQGRVVDYLDAGTRRVWVVEPRARTVTVYAPGGGARVLRAGDDLDGGDVLTGFHVRVAALFERT